MGRLQYIVAAPLRLPESPPSAHICCALNIPLLAVSTVIVPDERSRCACRSMENRTSFGPGCLSPELVLRGSINARVAVDVAGCIVASEKVTTGERRIREELVDYRVCEDAGSELQR